MIILWYGILTTIYWVGTSIYLLINRGKIKFLSQVTPPNTLTEPSVVVIIPVRNEEADLAKALQSVCQLNYQNYRILVINDRSTDRTPEILQDFALREPKISILEIKELPAGWLGKNNALYQGYAATSEEWMLFTDADVVYNPNTLNKALAFAQENHLDYLTLLPEIKSRSAVLVSIINTFMIMLELKLRPWAAKNPNSKAYIGVGAFMLLKRLAYEKAGTHMPIALRPDDDLKLGELVKKAGLPMDVLNGHQQISLEWYTSIREFINGLMKNTFSVANYNIFIALSGAIATLLAFVLPFPLLIIFGGSAGRWMAFIIFLFQLPLYLPRKNMAGKWYDLLMMPFAGSLIAYVIIKSAYLTLKRGGIYWRESFYPLSELRKNL